MSACSCGVPTPSSAPPSRSADRPAGARCWPSEAAAQDQMGALPPAICQHQKSWMIDAGQPTETARLSAATSPAALLRHLTSGRDRRAIRDGRVSEQFRPSAGTRPPSVTRPTATGPAGDGRAAGPDRPSAPRGGAIVQVQHARPEQLPRRPCEQSDRRAVRARHRRGARRTIFIAVRPIGAACRKAVAARGAWRRHRPGRAGDPWNEDYAYKARLDPEGAALFDGIEALAPHRGFTLAGVAEPAPVAAASRYVHAKVMLVDDPGPRSGHAICTVHSMGGNAEMNASIWDGEVVRALVLHRCWRDLALDTASLTIARALRPRSRRLPPAIATGSSVGDDWGSAFALSPHDYARSPA